MVFRYLTILAGAIGLLACTGCLSAQLGPGLPKGILFSYYKGPVYCNTRYSDGVPIYDDRKKQDGQTKKVMIPAPYTFGALSFGWGDMSQASMMTEGKIKEIDYVEYEYLNIFTVYSEATLIIYGR